MRDPNQPLLGPGDEFGGFRIEDYVASGGVAEVYRARDLNTQELVALKVISRDLAEDQQFRERFRRELQAATTLRHQHIIPVYRTGEDGGSLYLAMRYIDPGSYHRADLRAVLDKEGPLPAATALWILEQVAGALDLAHHLGLVHRDVTPYNILIERGHGRLEDSWAYLTDFGITRPMTSRSRTSTVGSGFVGTLHYVAPEQIRNEPADPRTDIYSLACVAFELLTTQPPYGDRDNEAAVIFAILDDPVPKLTAHPPGRYGKIEVPVAADAVLERALAKDAADRYATAEAFVADLRQALLPGSIGVSRPVPADPAPQPPPTPPAAAAAGEPGRPRRRWAAAVAALVAATLAVVAGLLVWQPWNNSARYDGRQYQEAPIALTRPADWRPHVRTGSFVVFSPRDVRALFEGRAAGWQPVIDDLTRGDLAGLVGVYVRVDDSGAGSAQDSRDGPLQEQISQHLRRSSRVSWESQRRGDAVGVDDRPARVFDGWLRPLDSTHTLRIRAVVVAVDARRVAHLVFFAPDRLHGQSSSVSDQQQDEFGRVLDSLDLAPGTA